MIYVLMLVLGYLYSFLAEYVLHRLLHISKLKPLFKMHMAGHHKRARQTFFFDFGYKWGALDSHVSHELYTLVLLALVHLPLVLVSPWLYTGAFLGLAEYFWKHRRAHLEPRWAIKNMPWHIEHHMGINQNVNWGIRSCWLDKVLKTYKRWIPKPKA